MSERGGVRFNILGPLEVTLGERSVAVPAGRLRSVLALLVLALGRSVSVHELAERLWPELMPKQVRGTIHTYVARLRRLLGDDLIETTRGGSYRIAVAADVVDLCRFRELVRTSRTARSPQAELITLEEALGLWRGRAFADMNDAWLGRDVRPRLTDEWLTAVERHIDLRVQIGYVGDAITELRELIAGNPTRELLWLRLIPALHRTGRRVEALEAYRQLRTVLAQELGIDPSETLQRMHRAILMGSPPPSELPTTPRGSNEDPTRQMPRGTAGLCGRQDSDDASQLVPSVADEDRRPTAGGGIYGEATSPEVPSAAAGPRRRSHRITRVRPWWVEFQGLPGLQELSRRIGLLAAENARLVAENKALRRQNAELRRG